MANDITIDIGARNRASAILRDVGRDTAKLSRQVMAFGAQSKLALGATAAGFQGVAASASAAKTITVGATTAMITGIRSLKVATGGLAIAVGGAATAFGRFDKAMSAVEAVTGATGDQLETLRDKAKELGSTTQFSATQSAEAMKFLGQAGYNATEILAGIEPTLALAAAGAIDLGQAADIASDVGSAFGLTADEVGRVADVLAVTATSANTNIEMMGETFKLAAPLAKAAGQSIEEMSVATGLLGNSGIKATVAGTDLKNILTALANTKAQDTFREVGIQVTDTSGSIRPMLSLLDEFGDKTDNLPGAERLKLFSDLFGRSAKSAIVLADAGGGAIDSLREKMRDADGAAKQMASTMQDNLAGKGTQVLSALEGTAISFTKNMEDAFTGLADRAISMLTRLTHWFDENEEEFKRVGEHLVLGFDLATLAVIGFKNSLAAAYDLLVKIDDKAERPQGSRFDPLIFLGDLSAGAVEAMKWWKGQDLAPQIGGGKSQEWEIAVGSVAGLREHLERLSNRPKLETRPFPSEAPMKLTDTDNSEEYTLQRLANVLEKKDRSDTYIETGMRNTVDLFAKESRLRSGAGEQRRNPMAVRIDRTNSILEKHNRDLKDGLAMVAGRLDRMIAGQPEFTEATVEVITH